MCASIMDVFVFVRNASKGLEKSNKIDVLRKINKRKECRKSEVSAGSDQ